LKNGLFTSRYLQGITERMGIDVREKPYFKLLFKVYILLFRDT